MRRARVLLVSIAALLTLTAGCAVRPAAMPPTIATSATAMPPSSARMTRPPMPRRGPGSATPCRTGWGTTPAVSAGWSGDPLYRVRAGGHGCFDRVVFDVNGPGNVGYVVRYVPVVLSDPKGEPLPVPGGAVLQVVILAGQSGPTFGRTGDYLIQPRRVAGRTVLRAVRFAGSFEGQCTFAVGVRAVLPFRVFTVLDRRDQVRQVVVDIARR